MECTIMTVSDLEPWASAIEMHILGDLEKIFDWGGKEWPRTTTLCF